MRRRARSTPRSPLELAPSTAESRSPGPSRPTRPALRAGPVLHRPGPAPDPAGAGRIRYRCARRGCRPRPPSAGPCRYQAHRQSEWPAGDSATDQREHLGHGGRVVCLWAKGVPVRAVKCSGIAYNDSGHAADYESRCSHGRDGRLPDSPSWGKIRSTGSCDPPGWWFFQEYPWTRFILQSSAISSA